MDVGDALRLDNQLCFALYAATRAMAQAYDPLLARLGVTYPQYLTLLTLWERDGISVKQLGERLYLDSGTLTPLLKRMEDAGLVKRARSEEDERVVLVSLTPKARRLKKQAGSVPLAMFCKSKLSLADMDRMRSELRSLSEVLRKSA